MCICSCVYSPISTTKGDTVEHCGLKVSREIKECGDAWLIFSVGLKHRLMVTLWLQIFPLNTVSGFF